MIDLIDKETLTLLELDYRARNDRTRLAVPEKVCDKLVALGLAQKIEQPVCCCPGAPTMCVFRPTPAGKLWLDELRAGSREAKTN